MALRSRSRTATPTSGPGRGPTSDGRVRHRRGIRHRRTRHRPPAPAEELRRRAELLFGERAARWRESGNGPPDAGPTHRATDTATAWGTGRAPGLSAARAATATTAVPCRTVLPAAGPGPTLPPDVDPDPAVPPDVAPDPAMPSSTVPPSAVPADGRTRKPASARMVMTAEAPEPASAVSPLELPGPEGPGWRERVGLALRERMPVWLQARCGVERRGVVALAVVLVVAAVLAVQHFWAGRTESVSAPQVVRAQTQTPYPKKQDGGGAKAGAVAGAGAGASSAPGGQIVVDVSGKVRKPGICRLPAGSRVADALRAAGGVRPGVSIEGLNRARFLVDGEQVVVGGPAGAMAPPGPVAGRASGSAGSAPAAPVSLNTATADQLDTLPGVGPVLAQHIVDYRTQHGGFRSVDELREVNGIGDRRFSDLRNLVRP
ncbi:helix-hairpin-helix domain-containing protein [Streptomyces sp. CG4]|uniref:helix-hairpin-helix domain-containing protein n=1 Tax=Streptomyces sp. CG4 TaxID=408783 RepID=UPI0034E21898